MLLPSRRLEMTGGLNVDCAGSCRRLIEREGNLCLEVGKAGGGDLAQWPSCFTLAAINVQCRKAASNGVS